MTAGPGATERRRGLGRLGEDRAAQWYLEHGFEILARNWRCSQGEIDIVACKDSVLVFCEVKARSSLRFGEPFEAVGPTKQSRLRRLAAAWLRSNVQNNSRRGPFEIRFDVVSVTGGSLDVIEAAF